MHLLVADRLTCPRCGPAFPLIMLAEHTSDRVVDDGVLGCPNCRDSFPVVDGFGDLRAPPRAALSGGLVGEARDAPADDVTRLAALLGLLRGPGTVALVGGPAALGPGLATRVEGLQVVGVDAGLQGWPPHEGWSRLVSGPGLPFRSRSLRGVAIDGRLGEHWVDDAARLLAPRSRMVVLHAPGEADDWVVGAGLAIVASEAGTTVAARD